MPIRQLAPDVAAKIAAGEVVERPASVVKELIENSIDAGATQIRVDLMNGGLQLIRVTDNGSGIPADELQLALSRHATSKVAQIDDLEHIRSLGFRGEALASIAAVADVTLMSRVRGAEQGAQVQASNGQISEVTTAASPIGTSLTVRNLFSAVPARLKFLKSRTTEVSHCHHMLEQYALAYPEIRFSVFSEGKQIFSTPGNGELSSVLVEIYGLQIAEQMVPISSLDGRDDDSERPVVTGYTSRPSCYKSTRQYISFFVNRRWVLSRMLTSAVEEAYHSLLLAGRHPIAVVNISIDPTLLDVNVHPAKTEIRFLKERRVYAAVLRAVRQGLLAAAEMPSWGGNTRSPSQSSPTQQVQQQEDDDEVLADIDEIAGEEQAHDDERQQTVQRGGIFPRDNPWLTVTEEETGTKPPMLSRLWQSHVRPEPASKKADRPLFLSTKKLETSTQAEEQKQGEAVPPPTVEASKGPVEQTPVQESTGQQQSVETEKQEVNQPAIFALPVETPLAAQTGKLPSLRVVGQLSQSYIVTEGPDGMYLIDQHAAHERILLERMVAALKARTPISQMLLTPMQLELAPDEVEAIEEHKEQLARIGFTLELQDNGVLSVQAVPNVLMKQINTRSLRELLVDLTAADYSGHTETWEEHALANVACKAAIKANYFLTVSEMREMIEQLGQTNAPYSCCHGRPTMIHFGLAAIAHEFERR